MGVGRWRDSSVGYLEIVDLETHEQNAVAELVAVAAAAEVVAGVTGKLRNLSLGIPELAVPVLSAV